MPRNNIAPASTLLDFLTHENPEIIYPSGVVNTMSAAPTMNINYHVPRFVKPWTDFQPSLLRVAFSGVLYEEVTRIREDLLRFPSLQRDQNKIGDHNDMVALFTKWNEEVVNITLDEIEDQLRPAIWSLKPHLCKDNAMIETQYQGAELRTPPPTRIMEMPNFKPDSGAYVRSRSGDANYTDVERFPKEYKPEQVWTFQQFRETVLLADNSFSERKANNRFAWPIRQAFSYCIKHECRYGCILTPHEAFIFRVLPPDSASESDGTNSIPARARFLRQVATRGSIEYVRIPWKHKNYRGADHEWTINLAFWYLHILAGNNYRIEKQYNALADERIRETVEPQIRANQDASEPQLPTIPVRASPTQAPSSVESRTVSTNLHYETEEDYFSAEETVTTTPNDDGDVGDQQHNEGQQEGLSSHHRDPTHTLASLVQDFPNSEGRTSAKHSFVADDLLSEPSGPADIPSYVEQRKKAKRQRTYKS